MTPAEEYLKRIKLRALPDTVGEYLEIMNNFAYETLKTLYNALGKEMDSDTILKTISNYKTKFHQTC